MKNVHVLLNHTLFFHKESIFSFSGYMKLFKIKKPKSSKCMVKHDNSANKADSKDYLKIMKIAAVFFFCICTVHRS